VLRDLSAAARARALLLANPLTRALRLTPECRDGYLSVAGVVEDERQRKAVDQILAGIPGVHGVRNEVSVMRPPRTPAMRV
jgi:osmotically-inducible protein OsmY